MLEELYFEDFYPGQTFDSEESYWLTTREIISFGERYDPQPFHIDETAGQNSFFHGLAASGWLTAAIAMRQRVQSIKVFGGMIGAGVEEMRWTKPVRPGDTIHTRSEILHTRPLATRPTYGVVRSLTTVYNQRDEVVMTSITNFLAPLKASDDEDSRVCMRTEKNPQISPLRFAPVERTNWFWVNCRYSSRGTAT